ncbi:sensor domain-containing diguanylate cyclase [Vibrio diazotrophicus]|uniref:sensor domain-containing diguanylate cyclase n=1 Tax=Vibrio diazotrophicus TaxID=685 RepID=UPI00142DE39E|nr:diguanylate cyclase [Vibrio diazotrophicus]NIY94042.1 sensor domain-containing diguanylate cyclase [Vibrio diazotrophicus]
MEGSCPERHSRLGSKWFGVILKPILITLAWILLWRAAALMEYAPHASIWFPPSGITYAVFLVFGWRAIPIVLFASITTTFWEDVIYQSHESNSTLLITGLLFAIAHCFSYWLGATVLRKLSQTGKQFRIPYLILMFLTIAASSSLLAAIGGSNVLAITGIILPSEVMSLWGPWWVGDLVGVVVIAPITVSILAKYYPEESHWLVENFKSAYEQSSLLNYVYKQAIAIIVLALISVLVSIFPSSSVVFCVFFLGIVQMWIVFTESAGRAFLSLGLLSTSTAILVSWLQLGHHAMVYQFTISLLAANTYFGLWVPHILLDNRNLRILAERDVLTGAQTRQYFIKNVKNEISRCRRVNQPLSLALFDIDGFKQINDTVGHTIGDKVLTAVSQHVGKEIRPADLIGRFGGDEFMLLLPNDDLKHAIQAAERIRESIECLSIPSLERSITCSFGVVEISPKDTFVSAFERADNFLLEAKKSGKNQVKPTC